MFRLFSIRGRWKPFGLDKWKYILYTTKYTCKECKGQWNICTFLWCNGSCIVFLNAIISPSPFNFNATHLNYVIPWKKCCASLFRSIHALFSVHNGFLMVHANKIRILRTSQLKQRLQHHGEKEIGSSNEETDQQLCLMKIQVWWSLKEEGKNTLHLYGIKENTTTQTVNKESENCNS